MIRRVLAVASVLVLAACGTKAVKDTPAASTGGAFPVTIEHKFGSTTIKSEPKRIVLVGFTEQDSLLALGVVPVATTDWLGRYESAINPWSLDKLGNSPKPVMLTDKDGPQYEKIASLRPDLILGIYAGLNQEQYTKLSQIAPTVAQPSAYADYGVPWQEATETIGKIVGKSAEADKLVADTEARIAKARQDNPKFNGASAVMATMWEGYFVYGRQDPRSRFLSSLGFTLPTNLDKVIGDKFGVSISKEQVDLLDQRVAIWVVTDAEQTRRQLDADPLYTSLNVAKQKHDVLIDDKTDYGSAMSFISVLSIPYLLDHLVPDLSKALAS
ncbi:iron-siderophore ABC transporter substrate-binding protein [Actinocrispum wychmicini]|uniref:Iron complex transport system substrate-binding protein n=1 Tax=Actinocrispum wychmicini TaxID=1213861 RepID=A0A4R2JUC5_9PSEU|nr:iron-siderophore ABC transporter substrate-binding protein [Actinocrispum wychmicini]TCO62642.1 iron complex transport system substrate-binding protein [Actinocrispum wychmicini]